MKISQWKKMLEGDMSGLKKEDKKEVPVPEGKIYRLQWASGQKSTLVDHKEAVRRVNEWMNKIGWQWIRIVNEETQKHQVVREPAGTANRGFLQIKKLDESMLVENTPMQCNECGKKFKKKLGKNTFEVKCPKCGSYDTEIG